MKQYTLIFLLASIFLDLSAQKEGLEVIKKENLMAYMTFFASDELQGREAGTNANDAAALYIASNLMRLGVNPPQETNSYFQEIPIQRLKPENSIRIKNVNDVFKNDTLVLLGMPFMSMETNEKIVFVGFGTVDEKSGLNELRDIDIRDKIVLVMTGTPESVRNGSENDEVFGNTENLKLSNIIQGGAKAILMVYNPSSNFRDPYQSGLASMVDNASTGLEGSSFQGVRLQAGFISQYTANMILKQSGRNLDELQRIILETGKPASFEIDNLNTSVVTEMTAERITCRNVIGIIEGTDPVLKNECIVYTAHFDHTGISGGTVYNGADDNASGSMALLEIASAFMCLEKKPQRTIIFAWMNAEEMGLLGSKHYTGNPVMPLENTILNINLDMVGRSKMASDTGKVFGTDLSVTLPGELEYYTLHESEELDRIVLESAKEAGIKLLDKGGDLEWGGSDHMSFRSKGVTAIMFHSGIHADLHEPGDDIEKIDFDKMEKSAKMSFLLGYKVAASKQRFRMNKK